MGLADKVALKLRNHCLMEGIKPASGWSGSEGGFVSIGVHL
jgi:hypothetical protein